MTEEMAGGRLCFGTTEVRFARHPRASGYHGDESTRELTIAREAADSEMSAPRMPARERRRCRE